MSLVLVFGFDPQLGKSKENDFFISIRRRVVFFKFRIKFRFKFTHSVRAELDDVDLCVVSMTLKYASSNNSV